MTLADTLAGAFHVFTDLGLVGAMTIGIAMGMVFGAAPGLSAKMGILLLMPLMFNMDPAFGIVLLISMHAVVHTGGSISSILVGVPGGAAEAATVIDGFAMAKKGQAGEALGASMAASAIGGVIGAICYFLLLPIFTVVGGLFGAPEYLLLALIGLSAVSTLSQSSPLKGLAMAALGLLAGSVGMDQTTATPRFVFGQLELWDGIDILTIVAGFFAMPELLDIARHQTSRLNAATAVAGCTYRALFAGMLTTWKHRWLTLRTTFIGVAIGMMPGLGAEVASWISYGHAVQSAKDKSRFGDGAVEGVIAPETANNSKEGGAFLPTVAFGVPSTATMALMVAAFAVLGLPVGPALMREHADLVALIGWTIVWSNILAVVLFAAILPLVGRIVYLRIDVLAPIVIAIVTTGTLVEGVGWWQIGTLFVVSVLGCALATLDWPRAPFVLGFIMGRLAEINLVKTIYLYDWSVFARWPSVLLIAGLLLILYFTLVRRGPRPRPRDALAAGDAVLAAVLCATFAAAAVTALHYPPEARAMPVFAGIIGCLITGILIVKRLRSAGTSGARARQRPMPWRLLAIFAGYLALIPVAGMLIAATAYAAIHSRIEIRTSLTRTAIIAGAVAASIWLLFAAWLRIPVFSWLR